jgi:hypothetical protein
MPNLKKTEIRKSPPAKTVEARENQLIAKAVDLAEKQLSEGTASSQVITHYLKLGSTEQRLRQKMMEEDLQLTRAKTEALKSAKRIEDLYNEAIHVMKRYSGGGGDDTEEDL